VVGIIVFSGKASLELACTGSPWLVAYFASYRYTPSVTGAGWTLHIFL